MATKLKTAFGGRKGSLPKARVKPSPWYRSEDFSWRRRWRPHLIPPRVIPAPAPLRDADGLEIISGHVIRDGKWSPPRFEE